MTVVRDGAGAVFSLESDRPLAVGSAFKLYVLKALQEKIAEGKAAWSDVIPLRDEWKSLPSGILQGWPAGSPVTLSTLASLMISQSDNTATDHLLHWLGRGAVEAAAPDHGFPLLSTGEMFRLKYGSGAEKRAAYAGADAGRRGSMLADLASLDLRSLKPTTDPVAVDRIEWFFTTRELCRVVGELRSQPLLRINPGLVSRDEWSLAAFKGGSEPGVLNYTHLLRKTPSDPAYAVSATVNDPSTGVDAPGFTAAVLRLIALVSAGRL